VRIETRARVIPACVAGVAHPSTNATPTRGRTVRVTPPFRVRSRCWRTTSPNRKKRGTGYGLYVGDLTDVTWWRS
jgi:hypothetical protein